MDPRSPKWEQAACNGYDRELFFPEGDNYNVDTRAAGKAKAVCLSGGGPGNKPCPILLACFEDAMAHYPVQGILGGTTFRERRAIRKKMLENGVDPKDYLAK